MRGRFQFSLPLLLLTVTCCAVYLGSIVSASRKQAQLQILQAENERLRTQMAESRPSIDALRYWPITIFMSVSGDVWTLSVDSSGHAELSQTVRSETFTTASFQISKSQLDELRDLLVREKFFELEARYGKSASGGIEQTMTIIVGHDKTTVCIHDLSDILKTDPTKLREPARALRVWKLLWSWLPDSHRSDLPTNQAVLDAVEKLVE